ncbi:hypothetical protein [Secundilactobacillus folii]|uniref:Uncharacterized protein n=1 Tax=Secundilactobacillus folii TaxID=2678357 RepID=A0A7X2XVR4_9LACO|nr:hypothetical protein [Secundilactobacillus folii]MTV81171.1 hypothetical protein [Secundilactobacillus folii]
MYKKTVITSAIVATCLCLVTLIIAAVKSNFNYETLVAVVSYIGVYAISIYLSRNNSTEKIVLTLVNILATVMMLGLMYSAIVKYHGFIMVLLLLISLIGVVAGVLAIWFNNKFQKVESKKS